MRPARTNRGHTRLLALNWVARRPGVASPIVGATKVQQLEDNLASLQFTLPAAALARLAEIWQSW